MRELLWNSRENHEEFRLAHGVINEEDIGPYKDSPPTVTPCRPCSCGCDQRECPELEGFAGYLLFKDNEGYGVTVWIEHEAAFKRIVRVLGSLKYEIRTDPK